MDSETTLALAVVGGAAALAVLAQASSHARRPYAQVHAAAKAAGGTMLEYRDFVAKLADAALFRAADADLHREYRKNYAVVTVRNSDQLSLAGCFRLKAGKAGKAVAYVMAFDTEKDLDKALRGGTERHHRIQKRQNLYVWIPDAENTLCPGREEWPELTGTLLKATRKRGGWLAATVDHGQGSYRAMIEKSGVIAALGRLPGA